MPVKGTKQTATILKDKAKAIPERLMPIIEVLRDLNDHEGISKTEANEYVDVIAANRTTRNRYFRELVDARVLEPVEDDKGKVASYRFHDTLTA